MTATTQTRPILDAARLGALLRRLDLWDGVLTFAYHRIGDPSGSLFDHGLYSATRTDFDAQMRVLASEADVISAHDLRRVSDLGRGRHVLLTFDDGYRDNVEAALPVLRRHGLSATFFLTTSFLDSPRVGWWDEIAWMVHTTARTEVRLGAWLREPLPLGACAEGREPAIRLLVRAAQGLGSARRAELLEALGDALATGRCPRDLAHGTWMTWDMARSLRGAGMTIGGHTASHPVLARESVTRQRGEILGCAERLRDELSMPMWTFSYPVGGRDAFDRDTRACLAEAGVRWAFSSYGGLSRFDAWDPYDIRRATLAPGAGTRAVRAALAAPGRLGRW